jgi:hypothetical protein
VGALGNVLLSQNPAVQVPSALEGLTVVFEMGTRGSPPPSSPNVDCPAGLCQKQKSLRRLKVCTLKTDNERIKCDFGVSTSTALRLIECFRYRKQLMLPKITFSEKAYAFDVAFLQKACNSIERR